MNDIDGQLVKGLKNHDEDSFAILYNQFSQKIYNLAFKMCRNTEDAEDAVQATFIQAFRNADSFREESSIYTWLYAIAKNYCLRVLEQSKKGRISSLDALVKSVQLRESKLTCSVVEKQNYIDQVKEGCLLGLLNCLSLYQRISFILNVILNVREKDVARIIDKSETATRLLIHRARQNMKSFLCKNCSLYMKSNPCKCEGMIEFSLKQGWIQTIPINESSQQNYVSVADIEKEISDLKKITLLYCSLNEKQPRENVLKCIREEIKKPGYIIFTSKKVK